MVGVGLTVFFGVAVGFGVGDGVEQAQSVSVGQIGFRQKPEVSPSAMKQ